MRLSPSTTARTVQNVDQPGIGSGERPLPRRAPARRRLGGRHVHFASAHRVLRVPGDDARHRARAGPGRSTDSCARRCCDRGAGRAGIGPPRRRAPLREARAVPVHRRGDHRRVRGRRRRKGGSGVHPRAAARRAGATRVDPHRQRDPPVLAVARPGGQPSPAVRRPRRGPAVAGAPHGHPRRPLPRGRPLRRARDRRRERPRLRPAGVPRPLRVQPVLARRRHRHGVGPHEDLRGPPHRGPSAPAGRLGRLRALHAEPPHGEGGEHHQGGVVGRPSTPGLWHRRAPDVRRHRLDGRGGRHRCAGPLPGGGPLRPLRSRRARRSGAATCATASPRPA